tara:strand:+ start:661 stop:1086 length:426 start_codon:yes stop_codon:yes gene_type:complete
VNRVLGIDYGERRIGLALSDPLKIIAKPFRIIDRNLTPDFITELLLIINENNVNRVVVGLPLNLKGRYSKQTEIVIKFIDELKKIQNIQVIQLDERMSSVAAEKSLIIQNIKLGYNKEKIDETAAAIILQEYLDSTKTDCE